MADPLVVRFEAETSRAQQGIAQLAGSIASNMASVAASMNGGASNANKMGSALDGLVNQAKRGAAAVGGDFLKMANDIGAAATKTDANLQGVIGSFTRAAVGSETAGAAMRAGFTAGTETVKTFAEQFPILGSVIRGAIVAAPVIIALDLLSKTIGTVAEQIKKLQDIQKGSEAAGIGSSFYQDQVRDLQRFGMTAEQAAQSLIKAREALSGRVDEKGGFQESNIFKQLEELRDTGFTQLNNPLNKILGAAPDDIETRTKAAREAMQALHKAAEETGKTNLEALADQIGRSLGYSKDATNEVKNLGDAARESGNNFDEGLVQRSKELDQKIVDIHAKLSNDLQPIMNDLARLALTFKEAWYGTLSPIEQGIALIGRAYSRMKELSDLNAQNSTLFIPGAKQGFQTPSARRGIAGRLAPESTQDLAEGTGDAQEQASLARRAELAGLPPTPPLPTARPPDLGKKETKTRDETEALETYMDQLKKSVEVLNAETDSIGKSNTVRAEAVDLAKAQDAARRDQEAGLRESATLTDAETQAVLKLARAEGEAKDRAEEMNKAIEGANARANFLGEQALSAFDKIGQSGVRAKDIVLDFAKALEKAAMQALLLGTGPLAELFGTGGRGGATGGLFGGLFGSKGMFPGMGSAGSTDYGSEGAGATEDVITDIEAKGGWAGHGPKMMVPASEFMHAPHFKFGGGIPSILHPGEIILNQAQQKNVAQGLGSGGGRLNITHAPVFQGLGMPEDRVVALVQKSQKDFARNVGPIVDNWQRKFGR